MRVWPEKRHGWNCIDILDFLRLHDLQPLTFSKHVKSISFEHVILKSCQDLVKQLLHVKRLPCRGVQVINHGSSRSSRIARQNLLSIVTFCTVQRLWRRSDGKERNYNAETGKLRHYFQVWRCFVPTSFKSVDTWKSCTRMTSALTSREQQTAGVYFQRKGRGEKLLKVVSSKALPDVRPNYSLFLTTTQFYSRTLAWLPWLVQGHLSWIFPCPPPPPPPPTPPPALALALALGKEIHRKKRKSVRKLKKEMCACFSLFRSTRCFPLLIRKKLRK